MDGVARLIADTQKRGMTVRADGERLVVRGPKAQAELAMALLARKAEVLAALTSREEQAIAERVAILRPLVPVTGPVPFLIARRCEPMPGQCVSCGEPLGPDDLSRCWPCVEAVRRVLGDVEAERRRVKEVAS
jgi:hypothetical protein